MMMNGFTTAAAATATVAPRRTRAAALATIDALARALQDPHLDVTDRRQLLDLIAAIGDETDWNN